jgi:hypothetical protein
MNRDRVRRYVERHDEPTVPQVLGRFELSPSAADEVREVVESPEGGEVGRKSAGKNLYRSTFTPRGGGWGGYLPYHPPVGGSVFNRKEPVGGGVPR